MVEELKKDMEQILHLILKRKWYTRIANGSKTVEYREITTHWNARLRHNEEFKHFDVVRFRLGYRTDAAVMEFKIKDIGYGDFEGKKHYAITLGKRIF